MDTLLLIEDLNRAYGWELDPTPADAREALETMLAEKINAMIRENFDQLLQLLYRIDINEQRLRRLLVENEGEDAGRMIAGLIMERQWEKMESRRQFRQDKPTDENDGEEKW
jgi:hypothetical protein